MQCNRQVYRWGMEMVWVVCENGHVDADVLCFQRMCIINRNINIIHFFIPNRTMIEKHTWKPVSSPSSSCKPSPRWGHSCCVIQDELVLFGGYADSVYMNDIWVYHTVAMNWTEVKTFGAVPCHRSNSSFHYDAVNNQIVMFGGGGSNKTRFNSVHFLDWKTKNWTQFTPASAENQKCPWERTYHSSELAYPYLIVFGGEGVADLDDLWAFNLETLKWTQIVAEGVKPCGRRFHSSCLIGNQFYVIAGCYSKYKPLSDVFMIDLTNLVVKGTTEGFLWHQMQFQNVSFLTRWGHSCASFENKIYIFGGRFSSDLNDILMLDTATMKMRTIKTSPETMPKPRRRACVNFIGSCLLMFGGFNSEYFNDLHYINLAEGLPKPNKYIQNWNQVIKMLNNKETADLQIKTSKGELVYCHKGILMRNFQTETQLENFVNKISGKEDQSTLIEILKNLYRGFGEHPKLAEYLTKPIPETEQQKQSQFLSQIQKMSLQKAAPSAPFSQKIPLKSAKSMMSNIVSLSDDNFGEFLQKNRERMCKDVDIVINNQYVLASNSMMLASSSKFFRALFGNMWTNCLENRTVQLWIPNGNIVLMEIIVNFLMRGVLVVPEEMSYQSWMEMYQLADFFSLRQLCQIIAYTISTKINQGNIDKILDFSTAFNLQKLGMLCSRMKINELEGQQSEEVQKNRWILMSFVQNRFEIQQKMLVKENSGPGFKKKISGMSAAGEKENLEMCNQ